MNGALLLIPLFLIRYGLLGGLNKQALAEAAHFPPRRGPEKIMYLVYQVSTFSMIIYAFFLKISSATSWLYIGLAVYLVGVFLLVLATVNFAHPERSGICRNGLYRISRNPMYVAYVVYFLGCAILTQSLIFLLLVVLFAVSAHWIVLAEERWCINRFGGDYLEYMALVRRYL